MKKKAPFLLKAGFFICFVMLISLLVIFGIMLAKPAQDIRDVPRPSATENTGTSSPTGQNPTDPVKPTSPTNPTVPEHTDSKYDKYSYSFTSDLSAYEQYIEPRTDDYLLLVNATHPLASDYIPVDLTDVVNIRADGRSGKMREYAEKSLEALFIEAAAQGMTYENKSSGKVLSVMSAYRDYDYQKQLFDGYTAQEMAKNPSLTREQAEEITVTYSNRPGTSEHQTGLCCDMHNLVSADQSFKTEEAAKWLAENCYKFGFILRYPEDKTDKTGVSYEPWHFRFVGRYHASEMHELGMCLEEYCEHLGLN